MAKRGVLFEPTEEQRYSVGLMAAIGIPHDDIALALSISRNTLRRAFKEELNTGRTKTTARVADSLVRQALAGNVTAAIFWLKTKGGFTEGAAVPEGKKVQARAVAEKASAKGKFATPPAPKLVVNNRT